MNKSPIFIHSLFRAGSTYIFKVFRSSSANYWCYQEPLHEIAVFANNEPKQLLIGFGESEMFLNRHPQMDSPYFQELYTTWPTWKDALSESAVYNGYFAPPDSDIGISYWRTLIEAAKGRPVFQECRTSSRIGAIKEQLCGYHIYLWRNPWDQWWSYKVTSYFDVANQLIINAPNPPLAVLALRDFLNFEKYPHDDIAGALAHFGTKPLSAKASYLIFYTLWCLGLREGQQHGHLRLSIDRLSDSQAYRNEIQKQLKEADINCIDFSDCHVPQGFYLDQDRAFFTELEDKVHDWLNTGGWSQDDIDQMQALRQKYMPTMWQEPINELSPADLAEQATRARTLARRFETNSSIRVHEETAKVSVAEARAQQAEARAQQAEDRAQQAEDRAQQAEDRAQQAEDRTQQAENVSLHWQQQAHLWHERIVALHTSTSWKLTQPIRAVKRMAGGDFSSFQHFFTVGTIKMKRIIRPAVTAGISYILAHPKIRYRLHPVLNKLPWLHNQLRRVAINTRVMYGENHFVVSSTKMNTQAGDHPDEKAALHNMSPRTRQIYDDLKKAVAKRKMENS